MSQTLALNLLPSTPTRVTLSHRLLKGTRLMFNWWDKPFRNVRQIYSVGPQHFFTLGARPSRLWSVMLICRQYKRWIILEVLRKATLNGWLRLWSVMLICRQYKRWIILEVLRKATLNGWLTILGSECKTTPQSAVKRFVDRTRKAFWKCRSNYQFSIRTPKKIGRAWRERWVKIATILWSLCKARF